MRGLLLFLVRDLFLVRGHEDMFYISQRFLRGRTRGIEEDGSMHTTRGYYHGPKKLLRTL